MKTVPATGPVVSIVIPTRDREELLRRAVRSRFTAAAGQVEFEVVVSVDGTPVPYGESVAREARQVVLLRGEVARGRGRARNRGLEESHGKYVKFLDDDDWLEPGALIEEVRRADETDADIVASGYRIEGVDSETTNYWPTDFRDGVDSLLRGEGVPTAAALYRHESLGPTRWAERDCKLDDWHFFLCAGLRARRIVPLRRIAYTWHSHAGQVVRRSSMREHVKDFYWVLDQLEAHLESTGLMTPARCHRLAQYRYKELSSLCRLDRSDFELEVRKILDLDPRFMPRDEERRWWMRWMARIVGFRRALLLWTTVRAGMGRP